MAYPNQTALNHFSAAVRDCARDFADGAKGPAMVLDGNHLTYSVIKMRYSDICTEFGLEPIRLGQVPMPGGAAGAASWRSCQEKIYATTRRLMPDAQARSYKLRETDVAGDPDHPINPVDGLGQTLWGELDRDCGGSQPELQTHGFSAICAVPQQADTADPSAWAARFAADAAEVQPVLDPLHIKDMLLQRLPQSLKSWADHARTRRSERQGHTDEQCTLQEVLSWLTIHCKADKTLPALVWQASLPAAACYAGTAAVAAALSAPAPRSPRCKRSPHL